MMNVDRFHESNPVKAWIQCYDNGEKSNLPEKELIYIKKEIDRFIENAYTLSVSVPTNIDLIELEVKSIISYLNDLLRFGYTYTDKESKDIIDFTNELINGIGINYNGDITKQYRLF